MACTSDLSSLKCACKQGDTSIFLHDNSLKLKMLVVKKTHMDMEVAFKNKFY